MQLFSLGSVYGTNTSASAAFDASVSVDNVLAVTLGDAGKGAFACASAAGNASVGNLICHDEHLHRNYLYLFYHTAKKNQEGIERFLEKFCHDDAVCAGKPAKPGTMERVLVVEKQGEKQGKPKKTVNSIRMEGKKRGNR